MHNLSFVYYLNKYQKVKICESPLIFNARDLLTHHSIVGSTPTNKPPLCNSQEVVFWAGRRVVM